MKSLTSYWAAICLSKSKLIYKRYIYMYLNALGSIFTFR